jgi:hypothetical protein
MKLQLSLVAIAAALLHSAVGDARSAVQHHRAQQVKRHHAKHHAKHNAKHHAKHHAKTHDTSTYASMQHSLDKMIEGNTAAEARLSDAISQLQEALNATTTVNASAPVSATLRGAKTEAAKTLKGNLSVTLKAQQDKLSELFNHLKGNIAGFNKRESDQKTDAGAFAERLKKRIAEDKKKLQSPSLSDFDREMLVNRTRTEEHELKFWSTGRSLQHDMFHSNLKLTHGLMSRVKTIMEAYKQVLKTGKLDSKLSEVLHQTSATLPKALLQTQRVTKDVRKIEKHLKISAKLLHRA